MQFVRLKFANRIHYEHSTTKCTHAWTVVASLKIYAASSTAFNTCADQQQIYETIAHNSWIDCKHLQTTDNLSTLRKFYNQFIHAQSSSTTTSGNQITQTKSCKLADNNLSRYMHRK